MTAVANRAGPAGSERPRRLRLTFAATCDDVRGALAELRRFLQEAEVDADSCGTAEIVLAEALNNVAEHAYGMRETGDVQLVVTLAGARLVADITDTGAPLPGLRLPAGRNPTPGNTAGTAEGRTKENHDGAGSNRADDDLPEGGFGWFLIHSLTCALSYRRGDGRNHLHMALDLTTTEAMN